MTDARQRWRAGGVWLGTIVASSGVTHLVDGMVAMASVEYERLVAHQTLRIEAQPIARPTAIDQNGNAKK